MEAQDCLVNAFFRAREHIFELNNIRNLLDEEHEKATQQDKHLSEEQHHSLVTVLSADITGSSLTSLANPQSNISKVDYAIRISQRVATAGGRALAYRKKEKQLAKEKETEMVLVLQLSMFNDDQGNSGA